jgi:hypothetical protein
MDALQQFQDICDIADRNYLNMFDTRIIKCKQEIEMKQSELKHWEQMKEIYLENKKDVKG